MGGAMIREAIETDREKLATKNQSLEDSDKRLHNEIIKCFPATPASSFWKNYFNQTNNEVLQEKNREEKLKLREKKAETGNKGVKVNKNRRLTLIGEDPSIQEDETPKSNDENKIEMGMHQEREQTVKVLFRATSPVGGQRRNNKTSSWTDINRVNGARVIRRTFMRDKYTKMKHLDWDEAQWRRAKAEELRRNLFKCSAVDRESGEMNSEEQKTEMVKQNDKAITEKDNGLKGEQNRPGPKKFPVWDLFRRPI